MGRPQSNKNCAASAEEAKAEALSHREAPFNIQTDILEQLFPTLIMLQQT